MLLDCGAHFGQHCLIMHETPLQSSLKMQQARPSHSGPFNLDGLQNLKLKQAPPPPVILCSTLENILCLRYLRHVLAFTLSNCL